MDRLSEILNRFSINAKVFFSGNLCDVQSLGGEQSNDGLLHLLKSGKLTVIDDEGRSVVFDRPSVIFVPRSSTRHRISAKESDNAEMVCAKISYMDSGSHPLANALPKFLSFEINNNELLGQSAQWLFDEAFNEHCGREPMIDRLCDIFLIQVLRLVLSEGTVGHGMLAGLAHPQLAKVLMAIHEHPERQWTLDTLADLAAMSRSKFAEVFREVVGQPAGDYIADWRLAIAQGLLRKNKAVGLVANEVGYENGSALARMFRKKIGLSPKEWLEKFR